uniref:phosphatidylinositol-3,5-bisphosphate 3-phosphatase n=1 Tax=Timema shepardi TaxID=629360 RepID=A0A7R9G4D0_TIMSH|nr:unnamed protein product [Timema shepardi]
MVCSHCSGVKCCIAEEMELIKTPKIENVRMLDRYNAHKPSVGTLYPTATHLIFVDPDAKKETFILCMHISTVEKLPLTTTGSPLQIRCKTFLSVTFVIPREKDCHEIYIFLQKLSQPMNIKDLFCFRYTSGTEDIPQGAGWNFFDLQSEFQRMGAPNDQWSLSLLNKDYELCDTYPRYLYVPSSASTTLLLGSSRFRSKGRLPVLTYLHKNKAAITRCSQPLSGFKARCVEDEKMLNCVLATNPNKNYMFVVDTRPKINAMANRAAGKGYENENFYTNIRFHFIGIENIHVMRTSLVKLIETCELKSPSMSNFLSGLESSGWLKHVKSVIETSWFIACALEDGISVVVHCSDGWDRTAQVCSLAGIFLDPYYRTIQGFQSLIEKDWLSFGHKFSERCAHVVGDPKEVSPVFTQFIDCIWQLTQQFPSAFQFNERFLLILHDHVQSCQFGTFVGNCEKERMDLRLKECTFSLWGYMANHMNEYINPLYLDAVHDLLVPNVAPQNIRFWRGMYCRFEGGIHPREPLGDLLLATLDHSSSLEDHVRLLTKRINYLKQQLDAKRTTLLDADPPDNKTVHRKEEVGNIADTRAVLKINQLVNNAASMKTSCAEISGVDQLTMELDSVSLEWKSHRNVKVCVCTLPFDHFSMKYHCWKCGDVLCMRCIYKHTALPGHLSQRAVPVCRPCYQQIRHSLSMETP